MKTEKAVKIVSMGVLLILAMLSNIGFAQEEHGEESGIQYTQNQTCVEVRSGVQLTLKYDKASAAFIGTMKNVSKETARRARVEVHLSNGVELGPTTPVDLLPGKESRVRLGAKNQTFKTWSAHAEVGSGEAGHGEEGVRGGEHGRSERGEHEGERGEHSEGGEGEEEEAGPRIAIDGTHDEVRKGSRLILSFDKESSSFIGTVENLTEKTLTRVRIEVHLSNGTELGPTKPINLAPGKKVKIKLSAEGHSFEWWKAHAEVGVSEY